MYYDVSIPNTIVMNIVKNIVLQKSQDKRKYKFSVFKEVSQTKKQNSFLH